MREPLIKAVKRLADDAFRSANAMIEVLVVEALKPTDVRRAPRKKQETPLERVGGMVRNAVRHPDDRTLDR